MSSLLGATYHIPWPPVYDSLLSIVGGVNVDVAWIRRPLNSVMAWFGENSRDWACNLNDMSAAEIFGYHYSLLFLVALSVTIAYAMALGLHKCNVCTKSFGADFKKVNASANALKTFNFFVFLLYVRWAVLVSKAGGPSLGQQRV